jgi:hypothetical protein
MYHRDQWVVFSGKMVVLYIACVECLNFVRAAPYVLPLYLLYISLWATIIRVRKKNAGATTALRSMIHEPTNFFPIVSIAVTLIPSDYK